MTKFHQANGGDWTRCRATVQAGNGVSGCPLEKEGVEVTHTVGLQGIAAGMRAAGLKAAIIRKPLSEGKHRETVLRLLENGFMTTSPTQKRVHDEAGKIIPLKERERALKHQNSRELPILTASEQWQVDERHTRLQAEVTNGLRDWNNESGASFRERALTASQAMESELHTSESLSLLLVVAERHNAPEEMKAGLAVLKSHITDEPNAREYIIQKAREAKRDAPSVAAETA